ncbi:hypothetical protein HGP17_28730 [Rhizobium sp. P38BS-XIX]|uniref:hypothetical protein n=1 Tax=Rhizobium sp. P38BS-XIX TaxID=2726740 RepID=UPI00145699AE|nr:hypothetical protein [Rhizobium sp. P38BS-XIX]NLS00834.1 hypothetical protein [Rhizobium sp. P38BS-XIX]
MEIHEDDSRRAAVSRAMGSMHVGEGGAPHRDYLSFALRRVGVFVRRLRRAFTSPATSIPAVSCADPEEAYMYACLASPFFCYVSPAIYGLTSTREPRSSRNSHPGEEA